MESSPWAPKTHVAGDLHVIHVLRFPGTEVNNWASHTAGVGGEYYIAS